MSIIYSTPSARFGAHEWRIEVRRDDNERRNEIIPVFRRVGFQTWSFPSDFPGDWPKGLFRLAMDHVEALGAAVSGRLS